MNERALEADLTAAFERLKSSEPAAAARARVMFVRYGSRGLNWAIARVRQASDVDCIYLGDILHLYETAGLSELRRMLASEDVDARRRALRCLWRFGPAGAEAIPIVRQLLFDKDGDVRANAASALGFMGDKSVQEAEDDLAQSARDDAPEVRAKALDALIGHHPDDLVSCKYADLGIRDSSVDVRVWTLIALRRRRVSSCLSRVCASGTRDAEIRVRRKAAEALLEHAASDIEMGIIAESALNLEWEEGIRAILCRALWVGSRDGPRVAPFVRELLRSGDVGVVATAADIASEMEAAAALLLPQLTAALAIENADVQWALVDAISGIGERAKEAVPALVDLLDSPSGMVASSAAKGLAGIGKAALPRLVECLSSNSSRIREYAADALGQMGQEAARGRHYLAELVSGDEDLEVRCWAAAALVEVDPSAESIQEVLDVFFLAPDTYAKVRLIQAIATIGPLARRALPALRVAMTSNRSEIAMAANVAIDKIQDA